MAVSKEIDVFMLPFDVQYVVEKSMKRERKRGISFESEFYKRKL